MEGGISLWLCFAFTWWLVMLSIFSRIFGPFVFFLKTVQILCQFKKYLIIIFIYLAVLGLGWGMWDLVPWPGIKPGPPALGACSLGHWTTREVPFANFLICLFCCSYWAVWVLYICTLTPYQTWFGNMFYHSVSESVSCSVVSNSLWPQGL